MKFRANKYSAFIAGLSFGFTAVALDVAHKHGMTSLTLDSPELFPVFLVFFFLSVFVLAIGPHMLSLGAFERIPYTTIPKNRDGWKLIFQACGRMLLWFVGLVFGFLVWAPFK